MSEEQIATLARWGWVCVGDGWWRDPSSGERRHWAAALRAIERDRAGHEHGMAYKTLKLPADKAAWQWAEFERAQA